MTTPGLRKFPWLFLLLCASFSNAQRVTIRVIDGANGHPLQKQPVSVSFLYGKNDAGPPKYEAALRLETDINGEAQFSLPEPAPARLAAQVRLTSGHWRCGCGIFATTQDLIQKGIVGPSPSDSKESAVPPRASPGVILILARPLTFFERLLYPLVKE